MKPKKILTAIVLASVCILARAANPTAIIPAPVKAEMREGVFNLQPGSRILADADLKVTANLLAKPLRAPVATAARGASVLAGYEPWGAQFLLETRIFLA